MHSASIRWQLNWRKSSLTVQSYRDDFFAWEQCKLGDVADISAGAQIDSRSSNGINRVTRIETISNGMIDYNHIRRTDEKIDSHYKLELNDILYSNINSLNHIGKSAIIQNLPYPL